MNTKKPDLMNAKGFGIMSIVVALGLASIMMMMLADMLNYAASAQRATQIKAERSAYIGDLTNILQQEPTCTNSLKGADITKSLVMHDPSSVSRTIAETNMKFQNWSIASLELQSQVLLDGAMSLYSGEVVISLTHPRREIGLTPITTKRVSTVYYTVDSGTITRCFGGANIAQAAKSYCVSISGSWSDSEVKCSLVTLASANPVTQPTREVASSENGKNNEHRDSDGNHLTVSQVVASASGGKNTGVNNTPAANVVTGVDHSVGKKPCD